MLPYLSVFLISSSLIAFSEIVKKNQRLFFVILAIALPCILAGYRASHIGTDTEGYLTPMIKAATSAYSFSDYLDYGWFRIWRFLFVKNFEIGFTSLVYVTAKFLGDFWTKTIIEMLIVVPVYLSIKKYGKYPTWLGMLVFYLITYNSTLNMIRQSVAVSFTLLGTMYLLEKNRLGFITCLLVAISFHISGLALLLIAAIFYFVKSDKQNSTAIIHSELRRVLLVFGIGVATLFSLGIVSRILTIVGLGNYVNYFGGEFHFVPNMFIIRLPIMILIAMGWHRWNNKERNARFFLVMFLITILCLQLVSVNSYSGRIAYYFSAIEVLTYPSLCYSRQRQLNRFLITSLLISYLVVYWWVYYGVQGIDGTIPYMIY